MFQVDPSMAGGEAMCPICHGVIAVPADAFGPPVTGEPPPPPAADPETGEFDFDRGNRGGMFAGLHDGRSEGPPSPPTAPPGRFSHLADQTPSAGPPDAASLLAMACPHCAAAFQVDGSLVGQQAMCPTCGSVVTIPDLAAADRSYPQPPIEHPPPSEYFPPPQHEPPRSPTPAPMQPPSFAPPQSTPVNLLPPGFESPLAAPPTTRQTTPPTTPLSAKSTANSDVPLSVRQPSPERSSPERSSPERSSPERSTPAKTPSPPAIPEHKLSTQPLRPVALPPSNAQTSTNNPPAGSVGETLSRSAKIDALLPEFADPDEEVVAERPIAVEGPPEEDFPLLVADIDADSPLSDADGQPIRRLTPAERAKLRRVRTILLFAVGMLVLILAAVLLPRMGFVFDMGKAPR